MCETRPGMMIYHDIIPQLKLLSDEQCGKLLRALLRYSLHGLLSELDPMTEIVCIALSPPRNAGARRTPTHPRPKPTTTTPSPVPISSKSESMQMHPNET